MAQTTTAMVTGVRAFNVVTTPGAAVDVLALEVNASPGGVLKLSSLDGSNVGADVTVRVVSIREDNEPFEVVRFNLPDPTPSFENKYKGVYGHAEDLRTSRISPIGASNLGLEGTKFRVLVTASGATTVALGATFDRRVDGPMP